MYRGDWWLPGREPLSLPTSLLLAAQRAAIGQPRATPWEYESRAGILHLLLLCSLKGCDTPCGPPEPIAALQAATTGNRNRTGGLSVFPGRCPGLAYSSLSGSAAEHTIRTHFPRSEDVGNDKGLRPRLPPDALRANNTRCRRRSHLVHAGTDSPDSTGMSHHPLRNLSCVRWVLVFKRDGGGVARRKRVSARKKSVESR